MYFHVVLSSLSLSLNSKEDLKFIVSILAGVVSFGVGVWGLELCLNENCDEMKNCNLFDSAYVVSIADIIVGGMIILTIIIGVLSAFIDRNH